MAVFGKKVVATKGSETKKDTHQIAKVTGDAFADMLQKFVNIKDQIKTLTGQQKAIEGEIKAQSLEEYIKLYQSGKKNPESIKIESDKGDRVMFIVMKKYSGSVDEDRAIELREKYGETFVEEKNEVIMDNALLEKYADKFEELFSNADFLTEDEKESLFVQKVTYNITPDAIDRAYISGKGNVEELISDISPVLMLKDTK
jgi:hypothetical protein